MMDNEESVSNSEDEIDSDVSNSETSSSESGSIESIQSIEDVKSTQRIESNAMMTNMSMRKIFIDEN
jgi:hypothetical protein